MNKKGLFSNIKGDFFGGLTAGIVALPLALAFGLSSGMGPEAGLYGAIFLAFFAALFGGTDTQISGPTAPMTAVSMVVIASIVQDYNGNLLDATPTILSVFMLAGIMLMAFGLFGLGKYIRYMPYPVVSGFMTAIGVIILITQIQPMLGYYPHEDKALVEEFIPQAKEVALIKILKEETDSGVLNIEVFEETIKRGKEIKPSKISEEAVTLTKDYASGVTGAFKTMIRAFRNINTIELILALLTILIIYGFKRITTAIPSTLVALLLVSGGAYILQMRGLLNYRPIPEIPSGFPMPNFGIFTGFSFTSISPYIVTAFTLALLGAIDSLLTSLVADNLTKTKHKPNKELLGQGIGNSIAALFGGIPGAGATIRTVVNIHSGGKTKLSGMIAGVLLLFILIVLGPVASQIPAAVLAGILITVGIGVMDYKGLRALNSMPRSEMFVLFVVMLLSVFWNLVFAVILGMVISTFIFMKRMADNTTDESKIRALKSQTEDEDLWTDELILPDNYKNDVFIKHLNGPLFFGYTSEFQDLVAQVPKEAQYLIVRMNRVPYIDQSGLYALEDAFIDLEQRGIEVLMVGLYGQPKSMLETFHMVPDLVEAEHLFENFEDCVQWLNEHLSEKQKNT